MENIKYVILALILTSCNIAVEGQPEVKLTAISSMERVGQDDPFIGDDNVIIKSAKNEYESFQVVVRAMSKPVRVVDAQLSELKNNDHTINAENFTLYRPEYVRVRRSSPRAQLPPGLYADPLVPFINPITNEPIEPHRHVRKQWPGPMVPSGYEMYGVPFDLWKEQNQPIWVDVYVPKETPAGEYTGVFTVYLEDMPEQWGEVSEQVTTKEVTISVALTVWNFTLPDEATCRNHFGGLDGIPQKFNVKHDSEEYKEIEKRYNSIYTEHRINPPFPHRIMPEMKEDGSLNIVPEKHEELVRFMKEYKVADFEIPRIPLWSVIDPHREFTASDKEKVFNFYRDYSSYVKDNGWDKRAYIYLYDEPNTHECYQRINELSAVIREAAPDLKILVVEQTYTQDKSWPDISEAVDIWCPLFGFIDGESTKAMIDEGDEVWSYTALSQRAPYYHPQYEAVKDYDSPYWHIDALLMAHRTPTWMNYQYGINGILYWSLNNEVLDTWNNPVFSHFGEHFNGGGYFIYPGVPCGIDGPIGSIRLKNVRESMEDYEYLKLYEELTGREAVLKVVSEVAPNWWNTTETV